MDDATPWQEMARMAQAEARHIAEELDIGGHWRRAGAVVNAVGSFRTNLLVRHRDIDFQSTRRSWTMTSASASWRPWPARRT